MGNPTEAAMRRLLEGPFTVSLGEADTTDFRQGPRFRRLSHAWLQGRRRVEKRKKSLPAKTEEEVQKLQANQRGI